MGQVVKDTQKPQNAKKLEKNTCTHSAMTMIQATTLISIKNNGKRPGACPGHLMKLYLTLPGQDFSSRPLTLPK